ncbi:MAG: helix-turn-helix transcriptional regulator [Spirosomataceae bacterium]
MSIVSENMKYLRSLHRLTQEKFANRIGIKRSSVGAYEEERANPNLEVLENMSRLFKVSVDDLLKKDLRKLRETPSLLPIEKPVPPLVADLREKEPQPLSSIFEQYYTPAAPSRVQATPTPAIAPPKPPISNFQSSASSYTEVINQPSSSFNNAYEKESGATVVQAPPSEYDKIILNSIAYVRQGQQKDYIEKFNQSEYLKRLPVFEFPLLPNGAYRAFEAGNDFMYPSSFLIGQFVGNWYDIADGKLYVLVARNLGIVCRRVYNQVKIKGTLLLSSDNATIPTFEVPLKDVLEVWEIKAFFSAILPEPTVSLEHLRYLVNQMQEEMNRIKK